MFPTDWILGRGQVVKALVFGIGIRRFESSRPSQSYFPASPSGGRFFSFVSFPGFLFQILFEAVSPVCDQTGYIWIICQKTLRCPVISVIHAPSTPDSEYV